MIVSIVEHLRSFQSVDKLPHLAEGTGFKAVDAQNPLTVNPNSEALNPQRKKS